MTWPLEYLKASVDFERFTVTARDAANLQTTHMAWTMVEGVLLTFRRRLDTSQAIAFANLLPPLRQACRPPQAVAASPAAQEAESAGRTP